MIWSGGFASECPGANQKVSYSTVILNESQWNFSCVV